MRGTLEHPPITISQSRYSLFAMLIVSLVISTISAYWIVHSPGVWVAYFLLFIFGLGVFLLAWSLVRPGVLILNQDGLVWRNSLRTFSYVWSEFSEFFVYSPSIFSRQPGCIYSEACKRHRLGRAIIGNFGSFGPFWELDAEEIVALLNAARLKWEIEQ